MEEEKVFCGNRKVFEKEKSLFIDKTFSSVHKNYDLMNNLMSFGLHHIWKNKFISLMNQALIFRTNALTLDLASGTGDIAIKFLSQRNQEHSIIISDFNEDMLSIARAKIVDKNLYKNVEFMKIDATNIPLKEHSIDLCTISFGVRNVSNLKKTLEEAYRVLKPNSTFLCMEFSPIHQNEGCFPKIYNFYSQKMIPLFGKIVAQDSESYQYLVDSINTFPNKEDFKKMLEEVDFNEVRYLEMNGGLVAIHIGKKY